MGEQANNPDLEQAPAVDHTPARLTSIDRLIGDLAIRVDIVSGSIRLLLEQNKLLSQEVQRLKEKDLRPAASPIAPGASFDPRQESREKVEEELDEEAARAASTAGMMGVSRKDPAG